MLQAALREASSNSRSLSITLFITGAKAKDIEPKPNPEPGSADALIAALHEARDPSTGEMYLRLKAGRTDWNSEFKQLSHQYGREDIGVCFCGAPMIAKALKDACEENSSVDKTIFRLHKENF